MSTDMRSAADIEEVGWPEPAVVVQRMLSTRSCWAKCVHCCTWVFASVVVIVELLLISFKTIECQPLGTPVLYDAGLKKSKLMGAFNNRHSRKELCISQKHRIK